jgi:tetratricopeptide (TPR) repeat protein
VGRERELSLLLASLDEVRTDSVARAVLISGPSGSGKSRIRHEFVDQIRHGERQTAVFVARAEALRTGSPLDLLGGLIRAAAAIGVDDAAENARLKLVALVARDLAADADRVDVAEFLGEIVGAPFPDDASARLANARDDARLMGAHMLRAFLAWVHAACRTHPVLFVLEDLQWGDHQTVRFIDAALREHAQRPLLILALARPEVHERFPGLWKARSVSELSLGPLSPRACEELVHEVLGNVDGQLVERIVRRADGNAFFLEELIRAASEGHVASLPLSVLAIVQARLEALGERTRRVLRAASVFGETFRQEGAAALAGEHSATETAAAIEELARREIVMPLGFDDSEYAFRHALVRDAVYATLTESDRQLGHALAGAWLETNGETDALLLAQHFDRAGEAANAARCFARAGRQAVERNDFEAAVTRAERAIDLGAADATLAEARLVRGKALALLGRWAEAEADLDIALACTSPEAGESRMEVLRELFVVGNFRQGSALLRRAGAEAMTLANATGRPDLAAEANAALASAAHADAHCDEAVERYRQAVLGLGNRASTVVSLSGILLYHAGHHQEAERVSRKMHTHAVEMRDPMTVAILSGNVGLALAAQGRYAEAREWFASARAEAERSGLATFAARAVSLSAGHRIDLLDLDGAQALAEEACELGKKLEFATPRVSSSIDLAFIALRRGDATEAERIVEAIAVTVANGIGFHGWLWRERVGVLRAEIDAARGDFESALRRADVSIEECARHRRLKYRIAAQVVRAKALVALGRSDESTRELFDLLNETADASDPAIRLRIATALLGTTREERARAVATESAARMETALPVSARGAFRRAVDALLARGAS